MGMFTWDFVTWVAAAYKPRLHLVVPRIKGTDGREITQAIQADFGLAPERVDWRFIDVDASSVETKKWWPRRDSMVVEIANIIRPVSIRSGGNWDDILYCRPTRLRFDHRFEVTVHAPESHHLRRLVDSSALTRPIQDWGDDWLIHWTRTCHGPWPGETKAQFFECFSEWSVEYCHSAYKTLLHILREKRIRASARKIGDKRAVVAFTDLSPVASLELMRWRPRWTNWAFEPYGIAIHRDLAATLGIRPVRYVPAAGWKTVPTEEKPFTHSDGKSDPIWPMEREWRCLGDVDLASIPPEAIRIIVRERAEAEKAGKQLAAGVFAFMESAPNELDK
ncbi:MAG: hypothetical protein HZB43_13240 [candidate division Zixibacteria bacterium]|nr:hypothetical protein [candidate division Zixibacteria bacterium]